METRRMPAERENGIPMAAVVGPLVLMLNTMARRKLMIVAVAESWVEAIRARLEWRVSRILCGVFWYSIRIKQEVATDSYMQRNST